MNADQMWDFCGLMAAIYAAPHAERKVAMWLTTAFGILSVVFLLKGLLT